MSCILVGVIVVLPIHRKSNPSCLGNKKAPHITVRGFLIRNPFRSIKELFAVLVGDADHLGAEFPVAIF